MCRLLILEDNTRSINIFRAPGGDGWRDPSDQSGPDGVPPGGRLRRPDHRTLRRRQDHQQVPLFPSAHPRSG